MNEREIRETLIGFVSQIQSDYPDPGSVAVVGIQTGGAHLARRLVSMIRDRTGFEPDLGILDITLYRDDIALEKNQPIIRQTHIPFKVSGKVIVLVDDVLYTGRTVRAALDAIIDFGRPRAIRLAVVIDRGLREFPIRPDYIGRSISTQSRQTVRVELTEEGKPRDRVIISMED
ncbi:bifunctional pyr operon transcriptional regulator/uracil phosphoribosyltransferase PyrR [bacterium]|nr:bifunctional pyr operon transcriptional regulator/uracil phosphoribosyltransferase PyrR [candidate division CSSED10-310 bacterium]